MDEEHKQGAALYVDDLFNNITIIVQQARVDEQAHAVFADAEFDAASYVEELLNWVTAERRVENVRPDTHLDAVLYVEDLLKQVAESLSQVPQEDPKEVNLFGEARIVDLSKAESLNDQVDEDDVFFVDELFDRVCAHSIQKQISEALKTEEHDRLQ